MQPLAQTIECFVPFLAVGAFFVLALAVAILMFINAKKRRQALQALAQQLGFQFYPYDPWGIPARYAQMGLFNAGHSREASNIFCGKADGRDVILFDYQYKTGSGKDESTYTFQVAILETPILRPGWSCGTRVSSTISLRGRAMTRSSSRAWSSAGAPTLRAKIASSRTTSSTPA